MEDNSLKITAMGLEILASGRFAVTALLLAVVVFAVLGLLSGWWRFPASWR